MKTQDRTGAGSFASATLRLCVGLGAVALAACSGEGVADAGVDAGSDSGRDAGVDAGHDAGRDLGIDLGPEAGVDLGPPQMSDYTIGDPEWVLWPGEPADCSLLRATHPERAFTPDYHPCEGGPAGCRWLSFDGDYYSQLDPELAVVKGSEVWLGASIDDRFPGAGNGGLLIIRSDGPANWGFAGITNQCFVPRLKFTNAGDELVTITQWYGRDAGGAVDYSDGHDDLFIEPTDPPTLPTGPTHQFQNAWSPSLTIPHMSASEWGVVAQLKQTDVDIVLTIHRATGTATEYGPMRPLERMQWPILVDDQVVYTEVGDRFYLAYLDRGAGAMATYLEDPDADLLALTSDGPSLTWLRAVAHDADGGGPRRFTSDLYAADLVVPPPSDPHPRFVAHMPDGPLAGCRQGHGHVACLYQPFPDVFDRGASHTEEAVIFVDMADGHASIFRLPPPWLIFGPVVGITDTEVFFAAEWGDNWRQRLYRVPLTTFSDLP